METTQRDEQFYRSMVRMRAVETELLALSSAGQLRGSLHLAQGQEALPAGAGGVDAALADAHRGYELGDGGRTEHDRGGGDRWGQPERRPGQPGGGLRGGAGDGDDQYGVQHGGALQLGARDPHRGDYPGGGGGGPAAGAAVVGGGVVGNRLHLVFLLGFSKIR